MSDVPSRATHAVSYPWGAEREVLSPFRFAIHIGWTNGKTQVIGWRHIIGPLWVSVQWTR
jgi:hypothetical protein